MEDLLVRRRNRLRHHYTLTSNVLLFGYQHLSDSAKLTYQVIDSFDWNDAAGLRKGFAYPSLARLAAIRGVDARTTRRHIAELERVQLLARQERSGKPSILIIEDPSVTETQRYLETYVGVGEDRNVRPTPDRNVRPIQEDKGQERQSSLTKIQVSGAAQAQDDASPTPVSEVLGERVSTLTKGNRGEATSESGRREHLAQEMLAVLRDQHSLGYYRRVAERVPAHIIYETLGLVKEASRDRKIRKSRGALFVEILKRRTGS